ncbi:hypothetical protein GCWU000246_01253 [Jonquetella anthropi E3_33 E1]|nr:hypothetical protein GCWU000246_01253 [Jonquetella anthropi E3_33 E1]
MKHAKNSKVRPYCQYWSNSFDRSGGQGKSWFHAAFRQIGYNGTDMI